MSTKQQTLHWDDMHLARTAVQDRDAAQQILDRALPKIYQVIYRAVPPPYREDICQAAAVEVLKCLANYRGQGALEAWVGRIAFRTAIRYMKKHRNLEIITPSLEETAMSDDRTPEMAAIQHEVYGQLHRKLERIPQTRRTPLLLHHVYGHTVAEVSDIVGAPINTVKDRLKKAVREVRSLLVENPELKLAVQDVVS